jgi:hypothetical protein
VKDLNEWSLRMPLLKLKDVLAAERPKKAGWF